MPHIWMTYDELAELFDCDVADARLRAIHLSLDRRKSRDGYTRIKLNHALILKFYTKIKQSDFDLDTAIEQLRRTHQNMAELLKSSARDEASSARGVSRG